MRLPALIARFPRLLMWGLRDPRDQWASDWPLIPWGGDEQYPELAPDFRLWREEIEPAFRRFDHDAQLWLNRFWRQRVMLIAGGLLATVLGAFQAASRGSYSAGVAVAQALLTGLLAGLTLVVREGRAEKKYLIARLKADQIKSEFFLFLGRVGGYAGADAEQRLQQQVDDVIDAERLA